MNGDLGNSYDWVAGVSETWWNPSVVLRERQGSQAVVLMMFALT